jgi:hypothetical protein
LTIMGRASLPTGEPNSRNASARPTSRPHWKAISASIASSFRRSRSSTISLIAEPGGYLKQRSRALSRWRNTQKRTPAAPMAPEPQPETAVAKLILARIRKGDLSDGFSARDIRRKDWSGLTDNDQIKAGLELLADLDWLVIKTIEAAGRPRVA